jgi:anaphase-promoting complex subunit 3
VGTKCSCSTSSAQTNVQLLATCYLHNNQPYAAYHVLKGKFGWLYARHVTHILYKGSLDGLWILFLMLYEGKKLPESRYLFATSCFRMNLLREAEEILCPVNEPNMEV